MKNFLKVQNLNVVFDTFDGTTKVLRDINLELDKHESLGIVGETGSGKSILSLSIIGLIPIPGRVESGNIIFEDVNLTKQSKRDIEKIRGEKISIILQNPMDALNPVFKVKELMCEVLISHSNLNKKQALEKAEILLKQLRVPNPKNVLEKYPFELSGGMAQRVIIAMVISNNPSLIIADEPTTALDATVEKQIIKLVNKVRNEINCSLIWISHDLEVVKQVCERVAVMYAGKIVEIGPCKEILSKPLHPYTQKLLDAAPSKIKRGKMLHSIDGNMPSRLHIPKGCIFADRCDKSIEICREETPELVDMGNSRKVACHLCFKYSETKGALL